MVILRSRKKNDCFDVGSGFAPAGASAASIVAAKGRSFRLTRSTFSLSPLATKASLPKGLSGLPLETFEAVLLMLYFFMQDSINAAQYNTILILNDYKDAVRRSAEGDGSPVASPPKAEVESGATMIGKPFGE